MAKSQSVILTAKQKRVLDAIIELTNANQYPPTLDELRIYLGYGSISAVQRQMDALLKKGVIRHEPNKARAFVVCNIKFKPIPETWSFEVDRD